MKKLFAITLVTALIAVSLVGFGQKTLGGQGYFKSAPTHVNVDTATNTTPLNQYFTLPGYWDVVSVQGNFTKISGTVAGTAALYGSNDNTGFSLIGSAQTLTNVASQTFSWPYSPRYSGFTSYWSRQRVQCQYSSQRRFYGEEGQVINSFK